MKFSVDIGDLHKYHNFSLKVFTLISADGIGFGSLREFLHEGFCQARKYVAIDIEIFPTINLSYFLRQTESEMSYPEGF